MRSRIASGILLPSSLLAALILPSAWSQARQPWDNPGLTGDPTAILQAAGTITADKDANITVLLEDTKVTFDKESRATSVFRVVYRVENQQGVDGWDNVEAEWEPWYGEKPRVLARVIAPDGHVSVLDQKTLTEGPAREAEQDEYVDDRILKGPLPGVTAGVIVEQEITEVDHHPFFSAGVGWTVRMGRRVPVVHSRLTIAAPQSLPLRWKTRLLPDVTAEKDTSNGMVTVVFDEGRMAALPAEPEMLPGDAPRGPEIEFSTGESWQDVANAYAALAEPQIRPEDAASLLPAAPASDRTALITQLVMALHKTVRYTGIEFGVNALTPVPPDEILRRHYGDCKDKAALLVSMLRAEKIPAYLALLSTSDMEDVDPGLPGMSRFDHAMVYVPGSPDLWIDATAEFTRVGELPDDDRGRRALIIGDKSVTGLVTTPEATPEDNLLVETRDFTLSEQGPAKVVETSESHGTVDEEYRDWFGGAASSDVQKNLREYVQGVYLTDKLDHYDHSDGRNLAQPFRLSLEVDKAKRGYSELDEASVAIRIEGLWNRLPKWFSAAPPDPAKADSDASDAEKPRTADVAFDPFITEWHYHIAAPPGFAAGSLPPDQTIPMGPATLTEHFEAASPGVVLCVLRFDTNKGRYTAGEAMALRKAIDAHSSDSAIMVRFPQTGSAQMAAGDMRGAFKTYELLIAAHPKEALHHAQMANALLAAGIGDEAQAEARKATQLEPDSTLAWRTLGWTLEHNSIGVRWGHGFDWQGAEAAYRKAIDLDKTTIDSQIDLGILEEFAPTGERNADITHLTEAVTLFRAARDRNKQDFDSGGWENNLLFDLLYSHQYQAVVEEMAKLPPDAKRAKFLIAATVAINGVDAGLRLAVNGDSDERNQALAAAGQMLIRLRLYNQAAQLLSAGLQGDSDAAQSARQIELFRDLQPYEKVLFPASDARSVVQDFLKLNFAPAVTEDQLASFMSRNSFSTPLIRKHVLENFRHIESATRVEMNTGSYPSRVLMDLVIGSCRYSVQGNDALGYNITVQPLGRQPRHYFVVKEDGALKLLTNDSADRDLGAEILGLLAQNHVDDARQWLDWARETVRSNSGDDPLGGILLPRFWSVGDRADPFRMKLAAAAMMPGTADPAGDIGPLLPFLRTCRAHAAAADEQTNCDLLLARSLGDAVRAQAFRDTAEVHELHDLAARLLASHPDSYNALVLLSTADSGLRQWSDAEQAAKARLARISDDPEALRMLAADAADQNQFSEARQYSVELQTAGRAEATDLNSIAWFSLFQPNVDQAALDAAQQANMMTNNRSFDVLHTLACVYAERGQIKEAREEILNGLKAGGYDEPNSQSWYVFGRIEEQLGQTEAAAAAYRHVDKPDGYITPEDTWILAQKRLHGLASAPVPTSPTRVASSPGA